jgi:eukaryotic-like serine/threonine-protein kinase
VSKAGFWAGDGGQPGYEVVCPLAAGGMGRVDLVVRRDGRFARLFAQKRLRPHLIDDHAVRRMFLDEGRIAGLVRHPHVVSVVDVGEDQAGPYLVMDFVEGVSLAELIARAAATGGQVPMTVALRIAVQVADGLHAVHETRGPDGKPLQLIHRDVSPQNVLIAFDGTARVSDFGIAKALGRATATTSGVLKGKIGYLAPERLRFEEPDRRADLFSFGVVLFELLAGRRLYDGADDVEGPRRILNEPPPDLADVRDDAHPELVELLFELLAKDRACRPADAAVVARRLEQMLAFALAADDPVDVATYVAGLFAAEQEALRARVAQVSLTPAITRPRPRARRIPRRLAWGALAAASTLVAVLAIADAPSQPPVFESKRPAPAPSAAAAATMTAETSPPAATAPAPPAAPGEAHLVRRERAARIRRTMAGRADPLNAAAPGCDPPYTLTASGERQFKLRCLVDQRR